MISEDTIKQLERNLIKVYVVSFFRYFLLFLPVIVPYFSSLGLTNREVLSLQSVAAFTIVLFEVPTGYFADNFKRKWAMVCSAILRIIAIFCLLRAETFLELLSFEVLFSLSLCFDSGADTAILYDTYSELKRTKSEFSQESTSKILSSKIFCLQIGEALSAVLGGIIAAYSLKYTIYGNFAISFIPLLICLTIQEPSTSRKSISNEIETSSKSTLLSTLRCTLGNSAILSCVALLVFINLLTFIGTWTFQMNWTHRGVDVKYFGYVWALYNVTIALSARIAPRLEKRVGSRWVTVLAGSLPAIGFLGMSQASPLLAIMAGFAIQICRGLQEVTIQRAFNDQIPPKIRATANSIISLGFRASFALIAPIIGYLIEQRGIQYSYICLGIVSFLGFWSIFYFLDKHQFKKQPKAQVA